MAGSPRHRIDLLPDVHRSTFLQVMATARHRADPTIHWEEFVELVWHGLYPNHHGHHQDHPNTLTTPDS